MWEERNLGMNKQPEDIHQWYKDLLEVFKDIRKEQRRTSDIIIGASTVMIIILLLGIWGK